MPQALFICTGNYYRSRFAEAVFNWHCAQRGLDWSAFSRGLAIHLIEGDLSPHAEAQLAKLGIPKSYTPHPRAYLTEEDLLSVEMAFALDHREHRPMMLAQFPDFAERINYWDAQDTHLEDPDHALVKIEQHVIDLVDYLSQPCGCDSGCGCD